MPDFISVQNMFDAHEDDIRIECRNQSILQRNLAAFGLEIKVVADGDCAFRSLVKQIYKLSGGDTLFKEHLESISLLKNEEEDTYHLRHFFVDEVLNGDEELLSFLPKEDDDETFREKAEEFRSPGVYDKMLGDSQILQLPIMVITSSEAV